MTPALRIKDLKKVYAGGMEALKGIDLTITEGDFFALLGPNGAGKTTAIGIVAGLVNKTSGTVEVFGKNIDTDPEKAKAEIGIVPQEMNFNIFEKVEDIIVTQGGYYGLPRPLARERAEKYLKQLGLWEKRKEQSRALSGGMKRRLMIARALVHEPRLLILDEPTAGVDIELRRGMWEFLTELSRSGTTIILTTHYLEEAEQLCKHLAIINKGVIVEGGNMKDVLGKLHIETFVFDLTENKARVLATSLPGPFLARALDENTVEIDIPSEINLNALFTVLNNEGVVVGCHGKLFVIESNFQVITNAYGFDSVGSGSDIAIGSMHASMKERNAKKRMLMALEASSINNAGVRPPFTIVSTSKGLF
jgi:ABC-2 type transport system ATP-binding protein